MYKNHSHIKEYDYYNKSKHNSGEPTTNKSLPCFLWGQFDKWSFAKEKSKHVCHHIIANNHHHRYNKPINSIIKYSIINSSLNDLMF